MPRGLLPAGSGGQAYFSVEEGVVEQGATKDEQEFSGIVVNETATSVTFRRAGGEEDAVVEGLDVFAQQISSQLLFSATIVTRGGRTITMPFHESRNPLRPGTESFAEALTF